MEDNRASNQLVELALDARSPRERTLAHLEKLLRLAGTTVATGVMLACRHLAVDPPPPPPVDPPPPPPPECCEDPDQFLVRGCIRANAVWAELNGQWALRLTLSARSGGPVSFDGLDKPDITLAGLTLTELHVQPNQVFLTLGPVSDEKSPNLQFPVTCTSKKVPLKLSLDLNDGAAEGQSVTVRLLK